MLPACPVTEGMINWYEEPRTKLLFQPPAEAVGSVDKMLMVHSLLKGQRKRRSFHVMIAALGDVMVILTYGHCKSM